MNKLLNVAHQGFTICSICLALMAGAQSASAASIVVNGDFETNTAGSASIYNMSNATATATVTGLNAFGTSQELDLVYQTGTFGSISPQSGDFKMGLHQNTDDPANFDAFSMELTSSVAVGQNYELSFWTAGWDTFGDPYGTVEIGLSNSANDFGTLLTSGTPTSANQWANFLFNFTATSSADYLTVRVRSPSDGYAFIDNVSLELNVIPVPAALPLLLSALGVFGFFGWRRRQTVAA